MSIEEIKIQAPCRRRDLKQEFEAKKKQLLGFDEINLSIRKGGMT
jgi:hypothetical protein